jgi:hypothetical protein
MTRLALFHQDGSAVELSDLGGAFAVLSSIRQFQISGHSIGAGGGSQDPDYDSGTRTASLFGGASEDNWARSGAILHWHNTDNAGAQVVGNGGWGEYMQGPGWRPAMLSTTLSAQANSGQAVLSVPSTAGLVAGLSVVYVGDGSTGELHTVASFVANTSITLTENLANTQASGKAVFQTPGYGYVARSPLSVFYWGINDLASTAVYEWGTRFLHPLRAIVARSRCAWVAEDTHSSVVRGGTNQWQASQSFFTGSGSSGTGSPNGGPGASTLTITVPQDYPGTALDFGFIWAANLGSNVSFTVDGSTSGFTVNGVATNSVNLYNGDKRGRGTVKNNTGVARIEGLAAGRHTVVISVTDTAADIYFDWWGIEAVEAPLAVIVDIDRLPNGTYGYYGKSSTTWPGAQQPTTLSSSANSGQAVIVVNDTSPASLATGTVDTQRPMPNQMVRISDPTVNGGTPEYVRVHDTTLMTGAGPFTITLAQNLANTYPSGASVTIGLQDNAVTTANAFLQVLCDEFDDGRVGLAATDALINAQTKYFLREGQDAYVHLNDLGQSAVAAAIFNCVQRLPWPSSAASLSSVPSAPVPGPAVFIADGTASNGAAFTVNSTGTTEWGTVYRRRVDTRRAKECRIAAWVASVGAAVAPRLRLQYSVDGGTTWSSVDRTGNMAVFLTQTTSPGEIAVGPAGEKVGNWMKLPMEARNQNTIFRFVQMATTAGTPTWNYLEVQFRG